MKKTAILTGLAVLVMGIPLDAAVKCGAECRQQQPHPVLSKQSPVERFIAFKDMESKHKSDWFNYMRNMYDEKFNLLDEQHRNLVAYHNSNLLEWQKNNDCSAESKDKIFADQLDRAIKLHKQHTMEWKQMCDTMRDEALKIQKRHEQQLNDFTGESSMKKEAMKPEQVA